MNYFLILNDTVTCKNSSGRKGAGVADGRMKTKEVSKRVRICLESIRSEALRRQHGDTRTTDSNLYQCICLFIYIQELFQSEPLIFQTQCQKGVHGFYLAFSFFASFFLSLFPFTTLPSKLFSLAKFPKKEACPHIVNIL